MTQKIKQQVYQDSVTKALFTVKYRWKGLVIISGGDGFYGDALTSLSRHSITESYFSKFIPIDETNPILDKDRHGFPKVKGWDCMGHDWILDNLIKSKDIKSFGGDMNARREYKKNCEETAYLTDYYDEIPEDV